MLLLTAQRIEQNPPLPTPANLIKHKIFTSLYLLTAAQMGHKREVTVDASPCRRACLPPTDFSDHTRWVKIPGRAWGQGSEPWGRQPGQVPSMGSPLKGHLGPCEIPPPKAEHGAPYCCQNRSRMFGAAQFYLSFFLKGFILLCIERSACMHACRPEENTSSHHRWL